MRAENEELRAQVAALLKRVADLEAKLGQNSSNSSKPPSSDPPEAPAPTKKKRTGRRPGGQPGHKGTTRRLLPEDQVDEIHDHKPSECRACGTPLRGADPTPQRHQVTELPPITPTTIEHRLHALPCSKCAAMTRAELPAGAPPGAFGPRLQALVALLTGCYRLSKRNAEQILSDCFGVELSLGSVKALEDATSAALAQPFEQAHAHVKDAANVGLDETGWSHKNQRAWLWTAVTPLITLFMIRLSRGAKVAKELVGDAYRGVANSDRWSGYRWLPIRRRQFCWAHLKRDFRKIAEMGGDAKHIGEGLLLVVKDVFRLWRRVRDGTLKRSSFRTYLTPIRARASTLLRLGAVCDVGRAAGMCKQILKHESALWTFARVVGVDPTNNAAERALRPAVIWRKTSFGTQSEAGRMFVERMLTVVGSLRLQQRNVLDYLAAACLARLNGTAPLPLLPLPDECPAHAEPAALSLANAA